jgi:hypothetical protein
VKIIGLTLLMLLTSCGGAEVWRQPSIRTPSSTSPGALISVLVGPTAGPVQVYLPGLTTFPVKLGVDTSGRHYGWIQVPAGAPHRGFCTLRFILGDGTEVDRRVALHPPAS